MAVSADDGQSIETLELDRKEPITLAAVYRVPQPRQGRVLA